MPRIQAVMNFDPATLMTTAVAALAMLGVVLCLSVGRGARRGTVWFANAYLLGAVGFFFLLRAPERIHGAPVVGRDLSNVLFLLAYGACHAGVRVLCRRAPIAAVTLGGAVFWFGFVWLVDPGLDARMLAASLLVMLYAGLIAREFGHGAAAEERARRGAAWLSAIHAGFYAARALLGPTFGLGDAVETAASLWGAIMALEIILYAVALAALILAVTREQDTLAERRLAWTDHLTGIGNRRAFEARAPALIAPGSAPRPVLLLFDLDHFKQVNDRHGHAAGDRLLVGFTRLVESHLPDPRLFWRLGGDEFAALLPGRTPDSARDLAAHLRETVSSSAAIRAAARGVGLSVAIGVAAATAGDDLAELVARADDDLYAAKAARQREPLVAR